jgi:hypothetical protein
VNNLSLGNEFQAIDEFLDFFWCGAHCCGSEIDSNDILPSAREALRHINHEHAQPAILTHSKVLVLICQKLVCDLVGWVDRKQSSRSIAGHWFHLERMVMSDAGQRLELMHSRITEEMVYRKKKREMICTASKAGHPCPRFGMRESRLKEVVCR